MNPAEIYGEDLAYIHEAGFGWYALQSAPGLLAMLRKSGVGDGLVVDLGCGSGIWARQLTFAGYSALGIDRSESMIQQARKVARLAEFRVADLTKAPLPACDAVTAIGEVLSFALADDSNGKHMRRLFARVFRSLRKCGLFIFDVGTPGLLPGGMARKGFWKGEDWAVLLEAEERDGLLTRNLTTFRKHGKGYRRGLEVHRLRLYDPARVEADLAAAGFHVRRLRGFGRVRFNSGHAGFLARKP